MKEKVTEISIIARETETMVCGWATFVYDNTFKFTDIPIILVENEGYDLDYHSGDDETASSCCPINKQVEAAIREAVIEKYKEDLFKYLKISNL